jgi:hypothetical protein
MLLEIHLCRPSSMHRTSLQFSLIPRQGRDDLSSQNLHDKNRLYVSQRPKNAALVGTRTVCVLLRAALRGQSFTLVLAFKPAEQKHDARVCRSFFFFFKCPSVRRVANITQ